MRRSRADIPWRFLGFEWFEGFQCFKVSWFQRFSLQVAERSRSVVFQCFKVSWFQRFSLQVVERSRSAVFQCFKVSWFQRFSLQVAEPKRSVSKFQHFDWIAIVTNAGFQLFSCSFIQMFYCSLVLLLSCSLAHQP